MKFDASILAYRTGEAIQPFDEEDAAAYYRMAVEIGGKDAYVYSSVAAQMFCFRQKDALWCLDMGIKKIGKDCQDGQLAWLYCDKSDYLSMMGRDDAARSCLLKALKLQPNFKEAQERLAKLDGPP